MFSSCAHAASSVLVTQNFILIHRSIARRYGGGRYLLQEKAEAPAADSTASTATETATSTASTGAAAPPVVQNTLADHEMIGA
jgi:hypothetical protein